MLSSTIFSRLETLQPAIAAELHTTIQLAQEATDAQLLTLCSDYIDAALQHRNWQPSERALTEKEQAFIAFTEQFITSVGTMSDEQVQRLQQFASADEVYAFINALYVTDMSRRLNMVAREVLL